jgi:hypothetical protein
MMTIEGQRVAHRAACRRYNATENGKRIRREQMRRTMPIRLRPTHTSCRPYAIYPVVSHKLPCHIERIGRMAAPIGD